MTAASPKPAPAPKFSVIIVNYNGADYLQQAVDSLACQTVRDFELIIIDNASTDGSAQLLDLSALADARLVRNDTNLGYAAANNQAAQMANGRWLALLNPDARAAPDWLQALGRAMETYPECRTFACAQLDAANRNILDGAGDAYLLFGFPWRGGFGRAANELPGPGFCFSACGASAVYDAALFRQLGGYDERFFCYCEDVDLGFRLQMLGEDCRFVPDAIIEHAGSAISGRDSPFSTYHGTRNRIWTYAKNMPFGLLVLTLPGHVVLSFYLLARSSFTPRFIPMLKGTIDGVAGSIRLRMSSDWRVLPLRGVTSRVMQAMAWNPWHMNQRRAHVRTAQ